ncbi:MAG: DUF2950 domain-containing protein [Candidatus Dadabacteria bacterium]|nr:DUF2950 domain-containing protein [Candidatus Dadabacteria bacterium]
MLNAKNTDRSSLRHAILMVITVVMMLCTTFIHANAAEIKQKSYASPEDAVKALIDAVKANNNQELLAIFGPEGKDIISSGDEVADKNARERFLSDYEQKNKLEKETPDMMVLDIGSEDWPFPIPIVKKGETWVFDTKAGKEELLNRRIGRNELNTIEAMHGYVDAQREYVSRDRDGNGDIEFAQKIISTEGKHDGLYWEAKEGKEESPLGPLFAEAVGEGYTLRKKQTGQPTPYHGYLFKVLKAQGKDAPGGRYDYVVNGKMILGYALLAYPASYGSSGIMTFIVNQDDVVYQKNLGKNTAKIAESITRYNPDKTWTKAEEPKQ